MSDISQLPADSPVYYGEGSPRGGCDTRVSWLASVSRKGVTRHPFEGTWLLRQIWRYRTNSDARFAIVRDHSEIVAIDLLRCGICDNGLILHGTAWPTYEAAVMSAMMRLDAPILV